DFGCTHSDNTTCPLHVDSMQMGGFTNGTIENFLVTRNDYWNGHGSGIWQNHGGGTGGIYNHVGDNMILRFSSGYQYANSFGPSCDPESNWTNFGFYNNTAVDVIGTGNETATASQSYNNWSYCGGYHYSGDTSSFVGG